jgi:hypothetical protein
MSSATVGNITFTGTFMVQPNHADSMGRPVSVPLTPHGFAASCIRANKAKGGAPPHDVLWLISSSVYFTGTVTATGGTDAEMKEWQAGIIQSIPQSERGAEYAEGRVKKVRFDTQFGAVKDGQKNSLFYESVEVFTKTPSGTYTARVQDSDMPNFDVPLQFSGDVGNPFRAPLHGLERTTGLDEFLSFFAIANARTHTIVTLGSCRWTMDWAGTFRAPATWTPVGNPFTLNATVDQAVVYPNLTTATAVNLPFSIFSEEAERALQIWDSTQGKWRGCKRNGEFTEGARNLSRWTDS